MSLCGDESERCSASDQPDRLCGSSQHMLRSTTLSTSVAISPRPQPSVGSAPRPLTRGVPLLGLLPEPTFDCNQFDRTQQRDNPIGTAKLNDVDTQARLADVLARSSGEADRPT